MKDYGIDVFYARVSTDEQGKKGFSIIEQKNLGTEWAKRNDTDIQEFFVDEGYTASNLKRPNIQKLLRIIAEDKVKRVVVVHSDRLVRDLVLQRSLQKILKMFNTEVVCLTNNWDISTPEKAFGTDLDGLLNELELRKISPRTRRGLTGSASSGNYAVGGKAPLGYKREQNKSLGKGSYLVIKEEEAEVIVKIFNTLATNRVNVTDMVKYLNKNKLLNRKWGFKQLYRLLDNPIYYGKFQQDWYQAENHTVPIVSKDVWMAVQTAIHRRKMGTVNFYLFRRLVFCEDCGVFTVLKSSHKKDRKGQSVIYKYYTCSDCKRRINENELINHFVSDYTFHKATTLDKQYIINIKQKIELKKKRIDLLNNDFDNDLLDLDYYKNELSKLYKNIKKLNKEVVNFSSADFTNFNSLTSMQQRALILSNVEQIGVSYLKDKISIKYREIDKK